MPPISAFNKKCLSIAISQCLIVPASQAASFNVNSTSACTLGDAITASNTNLAKNSCGAGSADIPDVISLSSDLTFVGPAGNAVPFLTSRITINGNGHTIERSNSATVYFRIMGIQGSGNAVLNDLTLSGGYLSAYNGGAIHVGADATLEMNNVTLSNNGVFRNASGAGGKGGGLYSKGKVTITNSTVSGNSTNSYGAGISVNSLSTLSLTNSTVSGNSAREAGGGIFLNQSSVSVTNSTVSGNTARFGGGISARNMSTDAVNTVSLTNSTVSGNSSVYAGGGIFTSYSSVSLTNSTVSGNMDSNFGGGGISANKSSVSLTNSTVSGNSALVGAEIHSQNGSVFSVSQNNLLGNNSLTFAAAFEGFTPGASDVNATQNNSGGTHVPTAIAAILAPLSDNGCQIKAGTSANAACVQTHALTINSPAINMGNQAKCIADGISEDQIGTPRNDGICDIGAFEFIEDETCFVVSASADKNAIFCL